MERTVNLDGGRIELERDREKKHCDLTYCLPLSNDSVFKRLYSGGGGCATRHLKINDERSNQTSIRPCPGQIFGGSTGAGLYFIFVSTHGRGRHRLAVTLVICTMYIHIIYYCIICFLYIYIYERLPRTLPCSPSQPIEAIKISPGRRYNIKFCSRCSLITKR